MGPLTGRPTLVALAALAFVACGDDGSDGGLAIDGAWARATPAGVSVGAVYLQVTSPDADQLVGASVDPAVAGSVQLHRTTVDAAGTATMAEQPSLAVPAGGALVLEPLGDHLMLVDLAGPLTPGATFDVTLRFAAAGDVAVEVVVRDRAP